MLKKINIWYQTQPPIKQFGLLFLCMGLLWFLLSYIGDYMTSDTQETMKHRIFHSLWMAFWWTVFFNWNLVKLLFAKKNKSPINNQNEPLAF